MYVLALLAKPTSTPLPVLLLLLDSWPLRRLSRRAILEKIPFFIIGGLFAVITVVSQARTGGVELPAEHAPGRIPLTLCHNIIFYLGKLVWPVNLTSHYPFPEPLGLSNPAILAGVIGTCLLIPGLLISLRWTRALLTGWLFFFIAILPTMGIIGFTIVIASDKYVYLPSVGLLMVLAWFLVRVWAGTFFAGHVGAVRAITLGIALVIAGTLMTATRRHIAHWRDSESLYGHLLSLAPRSAPVHCGLANALALQGRFTEAIDHYDQSLRLDFRNARAHYNLGVALAQLRDMPGAIVQYRESLGLDPDRPETHANLGFALATLGQVDEAIEHYRQVLRLQPENLRVHSLLAQVLLRQGSVEQALDQYREVLRLQPDSAKVLTDLAWLLATHGIAKPPDLPDAVQLAERACELTGYARFGCFDVLAAAYADAGRFPEAVSMARKAIELATAAGHKEALEDIRNRLQLYQSGRAYRVPSASQP